MRLRQYQYKKLPEIVFLPIFSERMHNDRFIFMQDGALSNNAKFVKQYLCLKNIQILSWPGNLPDFYPIEDCWALLKNVIYRGHSTNINDLKNKIV